MESDVRPRECGHVEDSTIRADFTGASDETVLLDVLIGGVVAVALIQTFLPKVVTLVVVEECSEVFPAMSTSLMTLYRRDTGKHVW